MAEHLLCTHRKLGHRSGNSIIRITIIAVALLTLACGSSASLTANEQADIDTIRARGAAYNAQAEGWIDAYAAGLSDDFVYHAYGPWAPGGTTADRDGVIAALKTGASYYPDRQSTLLSAIVSGDTVVVETEWTGTASDQHPTLEAGERQPMREVFIYQFQDGKIVEMREYALVVPTQ
jgi:ketosteroid isomerase-like protein